MERRLRLRDEAEVRAARARGKAYADGPLVARIRSNDLQPPQNRYTAVAGKRVGKAVQRNRVKRLVREALRHAHPTLRPGHDIVVIIRGTVDELPNLETTRLILDRIIARARLDASSTAHTRPPSASGTPGDARRQSESAADRVHQVNNRLTTDD